MIVLLDQGTKLIVDRSLPLNHSIPVIENLFNLTHIRNPGAAFGILADRKGILRKSFLILFSLAAIGFIIILLRRLTQGEKLLIISLTFILGGALGNLIDRIFYGEVIDFLDFYWSRYHWPAFNVADSFITVGVFLTVVRMIRSKGNDPFVVALSVFALLALNSQASEAQERFFQGKAIVSVPANQVINRDYFAFGQLIEISGTVNGDVYALGGQIVVDGKINGDLLASGGAINISGEISQDVRIAGGQINISGQIGRNLTVGGGNIELTPSGVVHGGVVSAGGNIHLASPVGGYAKVMAGNLIVSNKINGDLQAAVGSIRLTSKAEVTGDLTYMSAREASIAEGTKIGGTVTRHSPPSMPRHSARLIFAFLAGMSILMKGISFISTLILGLLSIRFIPNYHHSAVFMLRERTLACLGMGFVTVVVAPVLIMILMATIVGIPLALILSAVYVIALYWSRIFSITWVGEAFFGLFRKKASPGWAFFFGLAIYFFLSLIPVLGWLIALFIMLFGLGTEMLTRKEVYAAARDQEII